MDSCFFLIFVSMFILKNFQGNNIFGWGAEEIDNVKQPFGERVVSFLKMNQ